MNTIKEVKVTTMVVRETDEPASLRLPADAARIWWSCIATASWFQPDKETMIVFVIDAKNNVKNYNLCSIGIVDQTLVHSREIFRAAIVSAASRIVVAHNHPTGDVTPSCEDIQVTKRLIEAGRIIDIELVDHVIIGNRPQDYLGMRQTGICQFS